MNPPDHIPSDSDDVVESDVTPAVLRLVRDDGGRIERLGADRSFSIDDRERAWLVVRGTVDLFVANGGRRHHLLRAEEGEAVLGLEDHRREFSILAVPGDGAELLPTSRSRLIALLSADDSARRAAEGALAAWVNKLMTIEIGRVGPDVTRLSVGATTTLAAGVPVWPSDATICVDVPADALQFPDGEALDQFDGRNICIPLRRGFWFKTTREIEVTPISLGDWLCRPDLPSDLDCLHAVVLDAARRLILRSEREFLGSLHEQTELAETRLSEALRLLAGAGRPLSLMQTNFSRDPYIVAAELVLTAAGVKLSLGSSVERSIGTARNPIFDIASAAGLLHRTVHLEGEWWKSGHGPLLSSFRDGGRPCALLPKSASAYWIVDPKRGDRRVVTAEVAAELSPDATAFAAPLPAGPVSGSVLLRFGSFGLRQDAVSLLSTILTVGTLALVTPIVTSWIMNPVIPYAQIDQLEVLTIALTITGLSTFAFTVIQNVSTLRLEGAMNQRVAAAIWDRLLKLPTSFFRGFTVGDLANRALGINQIRQLLSSTVVASVLHSTAGVMSLGLMLYYNWQLAAVVAGMSVVYVAISYLIARQVKSRNREIAAQTGSMQGFVVQLLNAVPQLRVSGAERAAFAQWAGRYATLTSTTYRQMRLNNLQTVFQSLFHFLILMAVFVAVGFASGRLFAGLHTPTDWKTLTSAISKALPPAVFVAFYTAYGQFSSAVFGLSKSWIQLLNIGPLHQRAQPILTAEIEGGDAAEDPGDLVGNVEVRDVHFRYTPETPTVLNGLTLIAEAGKLVAVVGRSGAGKSSLVRLLLGFEKPERGSIFIDGKDLRNLNKRALRQQFGVVLQSGRILSGSVFHNITAGANVTRDDAWEAARTAGLDKDIQAMPMGMDTFLNEGATTISGGQRQRLMIARAVVRRPKVLIFDEATSALDNQTQDVVTHNLEQLHCTRIVVAHRLSAIVKADVIYVVDGGRVVEYGTFAELMALGGSFAELARRQIA